MVQKHVAVFIVSSRSLQQTEISFTSGKVQRRRSKSSPSPTLALRVFG